jgi:hypothetical protein
MIDQLNYGQVQIRLVQQLGKYKIAGRVRHFLFQ